MREFAIDAAADNLDVALVKLLEPLLERVELGRADEREVQRVEKKDDVFVPPVARQNGLGELPEVDGLGFEIGCGFSNKNAHGDFGMKCPDTTIRAIRQQKFLRPTSPWLACAPESKVVGGDE